MFIDGITIPATSQIKTKDETPVKIVGLQLPPDRVIKMSDNTPVRIDGIKIEEDKQIQMKIPYDIAGTIESGMQAGDVVARFTASRNFFIYENFTGSIGNVQVPGNGVLSVKRRIGTDEIEIGKITFTGENEEAVITTTQTGEIPVNIGNRINFVIESADSTISGIQFTISGYTL